MHFKIFDESERGFFIAEMSSDYCVSNRNRMLAELVRHPRWKKGMNLLIDSRKLNIDTFNAAAMRLAADDIVAFKNRLGGCRHAVVCPDFGHLKAAIFGDLTDRTMGWTTRVFSADEFDDAVKWMETSVSGSVLTKDLSFSITI